MKFITFIVASEGHYITDGKRYDKSIRYEDGTELSELREITDEEYFELFPDERPVEVEEDATDINVGDSEPLPEEEIPEPIS